MKQIIMRFVCLIVFTIPAILMTTLSVQAAENFTIYSEASFRLSDQTDIPASYDAVVEIPDFWHKTDRYETSAVGWYRVDVPPKKEGGTYSVFFPKFTQNLDVYFNGELIGSSGSVDKVTGSMPINWNRPHLFLIPEALWQSKDNRIELRLTTMRNWGFLGPVAIGPSAVLKPEYDLRFFAQITVNQIASWMCFLIAIIAFVYWFSDRLETQYLWFSVSCLAWGVVAANNYLTWFPISVEVWSAFMHSSIELFAVSIVFFIHRHLKLERPMLEQFLLVFVSLAVISYCVQYLVLAQKANIYFHAAALLIGLYNIFVTGSASFKAPTVRHFSLFIPVVIITLLGFHDNLFSHGITSNAWYAQFYSGQLATPLLMGFLLVVLSKNFVNALQSARRANVELEQRVADISKKLESSYQEKRGIEQRRTEMHERERIYRDLHDDLGAKLLSLVYGAEDEHQQQLARSAIADIRSLVSSQNHEPDELVGFAGTWHQECRERCEEAAITLDWQVHEEIYLTHVTGHHLTRILRELLTNAIKYADCKVITIKAEDEDAQITLCFQDDGCGFDEHKQNGAAKQGTGIEGIRNRLMKIAGVASWETAEGEGTRVEVVVLKSLR